MSRRTAMPRASSSPIQSAGQFLDVGGARADQQLVDASPERRAVALAARLRTRCEHEAFAVFVETRALNARLREHVGHHLGVRHRAVLRQHAIYADRDELPVRGEYRSAERTARCIFHIAAGQVDSEGNARFIITVYAIVIERVPQPVG